jgi:hypothetical protein
MITFFKDEIFEIKKFLAKIPVFIYIICFLIIFILTFSFLIPSNFAKSSLPVSITIKTTNKSLFENMKIFRISINDNYVFFRGYNGFWNDKKSFFKKIAICIPEKYADSIENIELEIGSAKYSYNNEDFFQKWDKVADSKIINFINAGTPVIYLSPSSLSENKIQFGKFSSLINPPDIFKIIKKSAISSLFFTILSPILILVVLFIFITLRNVLLKQKINSKIIGNILFLLFIVSTGLVLFNTKGVADVENSWIGHWWMDSFQQFGFINGYADAGDNYPPLSFIIIGIIGLLSQTLNIDKYFIFNVIIYIFLIATSFSFYCCSKDKLITSIFHLAVIVGSIGHKYLDILFAPFLILSLFALYKNKYLTFTVFFALSCLMKWQPVIILPFILIYLLNISNLNDFNKVEWKKLLTRVFIPALSIIFLNIIIFKFHFIFSFLKGTEHASLSANAFNFNWIQTFFINISDPQKYFADNNIIKTIDDASGPVKNIPKLIFYFLFFFAAFNFFLKKNKTVEDLLIYSILGFLSYFIFNTGVHQNHLFLAVLLFGLLAMINKDYIYDFIIWSVISNINLIIISGIDGTQPPFERLIYGFDFTIIFAFLNVLFFLTFYLKNVNKS